MKSSAVFLSVVFVVLSACSSTGSDDDSASVQATGVTNHTNETKISATELPLGKEHSVVSTRLLEADGPGGTGTLELISDAFGKDIETPGLYRDDHYKVEHITEEVDTEVGPHFVFSIHRDVDGDRGKFSDRQRNEIKIANNSDAETKGFKGETYEYAWKFKLNSSIEVSKRFSHFFQLKAKYGDDSMPIVTISASEQRGKDTLQVRHASSTSGKLVFLDVADLDLARGEWLDVLVRTRYSEAEEGGFLQVSVTRLRDGLTVLSVDESNLDMWRGPINKNEKGRVPMVRPKWGIYRSLADLDNLRANEEIVRFANFRISELK